jgi:hypothetical protein
MLDITGWDPKLIVLQMIAVQVAFYLCVGVFILVLDLAFGVSPSFQQFFDVDLPFFSDSRSGISMVGVLLAAPLGYFIVVVISFPRSFVLVQFVSRPKKVLDFSVTRFIIHFVTCCSYSTSFPVSWIWWLCNILSVVVETLLGEFLCVRREMKKIPNLSVVTV